MRASAQVLRTAAGPGGTSSPTRAILGLAPGRAGAGTGAEEGGRDNQPSRRWARLPPTELPVPKAGGWTGGTGGARRGRPV